MATDGAGADTSGSGVMPGVVTNYRNWVMRQSRGMRVLLLVGLFAVFMAVGLGLAALPVSNILTQIVAWLVVLFLLYTLYALARSVVSNVRA